MSEHAAALISRLVDINFEFIKGTGHWPSLKEITPPNLELIRDCGRQAEKHAEALIAEWEQAVQQRDDLLAALKGLRDMVDVCIDRKALDPVKHYAEGMLLAKYLSAADAAITRAEGEAE